MSENAFVVCSDRSLNEFLRRVVELQDEHKHVTWTYKTGKDRSLPQLALAHIWLRKYAAFLLRKPEDALTDGELNGMKRSAKKQYYREYGHDFMVETIRDPFHPDTARPELTSMGKWKAGELYQFMEWLQGKAAGDGLILESTGEHQKLKQRQNQ